MLLEIAEHHRARAAWRLALTWGAARLYWVADAFRQSCSYGPVARDGGCNKAEPAYDLLDCWRLEWSWL